MHIPFCKQKCYYCDFLSAPASQTMIAQYTDALIREIRYRAEQTGGRKAGCVRSVFFGGGTPSYIPAEAIAEVLAAIRQSFWVEPAAEITLECNPGTLTAQKVRLYRKAGINRISLGLQSTDNRCLKAIGRIHTWEDFLESYYLCKNAGFDNINIDIMSALPQQTVNAYTMGLKQLLALEPAHISAYSLIVEPDTPMEQMVLENGSDWLPSEEQDREMYKLTGTILKSAGYARYEISNYSRPGRECVHNCGYWKREPYLGFGLGAASLWQEERYQNDQCLDTYIQNAGISDIRKEREQLSKKSQMEEFMFLGLRMQKGVSKAEFETRFGVTAESLYQDVIQKYKNLGLLAETEERLYLTERGIDVSNQIFCDFLLE